MSDLRMPAAADDTSPAAGGRPGVERLHLPVASELADQAVGLWTEVFGTLDLDARAVLSGSEQAACEHLLYVARDGAGLAGTCRVARGQIAPAIGSLGEVATHPRYRRRGVAASLCERARDDFLAAGGTALFLGTGNPHAARLYQRLGWRRLASSNVMALVAGEGSVEEYLVDWFRVSPAGGPHHDAVTVVAGSAALRAAIVPLILTPHDCEVLDANIGLLSTRSHLQRSCNGLYRRYEQLAAGGGRWWAALVDGRPVGLASARPDSEGSVSVSAFTHHRYTAPWRSLVDAAVEWATAEGAHAVTATMGAGDELLRDQLATAGFGSAAAGRPLRLADGEVQTIRLCRELT